MPRIIILCGIPGSGKSTWADWYWDHSWNTTIISRDEIRETKFPQPYQYSKENEDVVTKLFRSKLIEAINGKWDIVLDNTHASKYWLDSILTECKALTFGKDYRILLKFFDIALWKAQWRVRRRFKKNSKHVPKNVVKNMHKNYKKINKLKYADYIL